MKKGLVLLLAGAFACCSLAYAAPSVLSDTQMDDQGIISLLLGTVANQNTPTDMSEVDVEVSDNAIAEAGNANSGNIATTGAADTNAIAGYGNANIDLTLAKLNVAANGSVAAMDTATVTTNELEAEEGGLIATSGGVNNDIEAEEGGIAVANDAQVYKTEYEAEEGGLIGTGQSGVADVEAEEGGNAAANDSDIIDCETDVEVDIDDSFNTDAETLTVSGQDNATAIVLANALDEQNINAQLVLTNSASNAPTNFNGELFTIDIPAATALSAGCQIGVNDTGVVLGVFCTEVEVGGDVFDGAGDLLSTLPAIPVE